MYRIGSRNCYSFRNCKLVFNNISVIGYGLMGSAIAAHFANAGCEVILLDIVRRGYI